MLTNARFRSFGIQVLLVAAVCGIFATIVGSTVANLRARGIPLGLSFFTQPAGFQIVETILPYTSRDPYWWAAVVGLANSLFISFLVIVLASILGLFIGIGRLSSNPLVSGFCRVWVEIARNTPVVVLLIFIYALWGKILPQIQSAWEIAPGVHLSLRGLAMPAIRWSGSPIALVILPAIVIAALVVASLLADRRQSSTGVRPLYVIWTIFGVAFMLIALTLLWRAAWTIEVPEFQRSNFRGGWQLTPELTTILLGLTIYTAGFIGEIVRGGIVAIGKGQWEAAGSLGLTRAQSYRLVIVPLALRTIVPPLNSQFINVVKNSTLAIVVGYQDFMTVMGTIINKSSHALEGIAIILFVFLIVNLALSVLMNAYNRRIALVER